MHTLSLHDALPISRRGRAVVSHPLAGSARRVGNETEDRRRTDALLASDKDLHEHRFVVEAILDGLDGLIDGLRRMREIIRDEDRAALHDRLRRAREARANLPTRATQPNELAEVRIPIPDRTGAAAEVFTLAAELGVNITSFEVVHSVEGNRGVAIVLVDILSADLFRGGLLARGFRPAVQRLD